MAESSDWVDLPGFDAQLRREKEIRARAFHPRLEPPKIAGEPVRILTLNLLLELEANKVAFVTPWKFESNLELGAECARFIWYISEARLKWMPRGRIFRHFIRLRQVARVALHPNALADLRDYLDEAMYDAPFAAEGAPQRSMTHWVAAVIDMVGASGSIISSAELLAMPLGQLWQIYRLAFARVTDSPLLNPSDRWAQKEIEKINQARRERAI
jgi:hypothetical protein